MLLFVSRFSAAILAVAIAVLGASSVFADPPVPSPANTTCPTVQCMRVTGITDNFDGSFSVQFETFNWFDTTADTGVNRILFFTNTLPSKTCPGGSPDIQVEVLGALAPPGWTVVQADNQMVVFQATSTAFEIAEIGLCDPLVLGGCHTTLTCGNNLDGFVITLRPQVPTGLVCSWVGNWRHLDEFGVDNGDVMNFGAVSWTFGSLVEDYSNTPYPPSLFPLTNTGTCARKAQKKATKYGRTRLKEYGKCRDAINKGQTCDTVRRDLKVDLAKTKMEQAIDDNCTDTAVANIGWCGTTVPALKTCLVNQIDAAIDQAILATYGP